MMQAMRYSKSDSARRGTVLLAVLVVIVVLSLAAYKYSELMSTELRATNTILKTSQVKAFAESGVHYVAAALATSDSITNNLNGSIYDNSDKFSGIVIQDDGGPRKGMFSIVSVDYSGDQSFGGSLPMSYGVADESGKININAIMQLDSTGKILHDMLMKLPNMTEDIANSIIDWVDPDEDTRDGGAESSYYEALNPPYSCKNGPLNSLEELLLVKGVTPALLFGNDLSKNGQADPRSNDASNNGVDTGWAPYLTVYSRELNVDATGTPRIYLNGTDLATLNTQLQAIVTPELAAYVLAYRLLTVEPTPPGGAAAPKASTTSVTKIGPGKDTDTTTTITKIGSSSDLIAAVSKALAGTPKPKKSISSVFNLIGSSVSQSTTTTNKTKNGTTTTIVKTIYPFPLADAGAMRTALPDAIDKTTVRKGTEIPARVNINTAQRDVLLGLPNLTEDIADQIIAKRPAPGTEANADPIFETPAWLATELTLPTATLQGLERYVTTRTQVYRFQSIGYFDQGGPIYRIEAIVDSNLGKPRIVYYRDLTELGRAFDPRQQP